jgi:formate hydrogenlyase subunit 6/NADH:ubiquinone oxidoreductase subunit I
MLTEIVGAVLRLTDIAPNYTGSRCLLGHHAVGGCDLCEKACPHEAIRLHETRAEVLESACTGCGLCVQACPTGALEYEIEPVLKKLKDQGVRTDANAPAVQASLECSKVPGAVNMVSCLARVTPAALLASAAWGQELTMVHGDCEGCDLGEISAIRTASAARRCAEQYRNSSQPARWVQIVEDTIDRPVMPAQATSEARLVSRRDAFGSWFSSIKRGAANVIPDVELPGILTTLEPNAVPEEWRWRRTLSAKSPEKTFWPAPVVNANCTLCQVCETVCPTSALHRETLEDDTHELTLELANCTGCDACVKSCPTHAMRLEPFWTLDALSSIVVLR